jgi:hypothetical protein
VLFLRLNIAKFSPERISKIKTLVMISVVAVFFAQSSLTFLLVYSIDNPQSFQKHYLKADKKVMTLHETIEKQLIDLLDFGQDPTQKKSANSNQTVSLFNLFVEKGGLELPNNQIVSTKVIANFNYKIGQFQFFYQKIPHPPQFI